LSLDRENNTFRSTRRSGEYFSENLYRRNSGLTGFAIRANCRIRKNWNKFYIIRWKVAGIPYCTDYKSAWAGLAETCVEA